METTQLNLEVIFEDFSKEKNIKFFEYHKKHAEVYETFKRLAIETKNKGFKHFSTRGIFQVMRWHEGGTIKDDGYKYNNNYTPYYSRLLEQEMPSFKGFLLQRKIKYEWK